MHVRRFINTLKSVAYTLSALGALIVFNSCSVQTPARDGDKPDPEKITVFYPLGDKVRGRGGPGAVRPGTEFVYIATFPSSGRQVTRANEDGSFEFSVYAGSRDVIELAYSNDKANPVGHLFTWTLHWLAYSRMINSAARAWKRRQFSWKMHSLWHCWPDCSGANAFNNCMTTANCAKHSGRTWFQPMPMQFAWRSTQGGAVSITGKLINAPLAVISVENRGKQGVGLPGRITHKTYDMTDEEGNFELSISAAGDDELIFEFTSSMVSGLANIPSWFRTQILQGLISWRISRI